MSRVRRTCTECGKTKTSAGFPRPRHALRRVCNACRRQLVEDLIYLRKCLPSWAAVDRYLGISDTTRLSYFHQQRYPREEIRDAIQEGRRRQQQKIRKDAARRGMRSRKRCARCRSLHRNPTTWCQGCIDWLERQAEVHV